MTGATAEAEGSFLRQGLLVPLDERKTFLKRLWPVGMKVTSQDWSPVTVDPPC